MKEKKFIMKAKKDAKAFDYLYEKYFQQIYNYVKMRVNNKDIAEDIVSTVFYKGLKKLHQFRWKKIPLSSWLYRIAISEISNYFRARKRERKIGRKLRVEKQVRKNQEEVVYKYDFIYQYLRQLPLKDQEIITLRFFDNKSYTEIAEILKTKENTLRVKLHRALKKLEKLIPEEVLEDVYRKVS